MWIRRNPAVLDSILNWRTREKSAREPTSGHPTLLPADQSKSWFGFCLFLFA